MERLRKLSDFFLKDGGLCDMQLHFYKCCILVRYENAATFYCYVNNLQSAAVGISVGLAMVRICLSESRLLLPDFPVFRTSLQVADPFYRLK